MTGSEGQGSHPGRPRSERARRAVLDTALRQAQRDGYSSVTLKGIAAEAGVGRQTIYRWWPSKGDVLLEAVAERAARAARPIPTGELTSDLRATLRATFALSTPLGPIVTGLMADATSDPDFAARLWQGLLEPRRQVVRDILDEGRRRGGLDPAFDTGLLTDLIFGTMWYRLFTGHAPVNQRLADELTRVAAGLLGATDSGAADMRDRRTNP